MSISKKMLWLHRLQQRLSITRNEALTLITLSAFLVLGLSVRLYQQSAQTVRPEAYHDFDRLFSQLSREAEVDSATFAEEPQSEPGAPMQNTAPGPKKTIRKAPGKPLDLNKATAAELEELPRIGPKTAERIISYRSMYGPFLTLEDLTAVRGIGPKTLALLRPHLVVPADSSGGLR